MKAYLLFDTDLAPVGRLIEDYVKSLAREIEIPEGIDGISLSGYGLECRQCIKQVPCLANIPISRPKKKVKKWRWVYFYKGDIAITRCNYANEEELKTSRLRYDWCHRIDETMIEVEE